MKDINHNLPNEMVEPELNENKETVETWTRETIESQRIDDFISSKHPEFTLSKVRRIIKDGIVTLNGEATKPNKKLHRGDVICFYPEKILETSLKPEQMDFEILYEDEYFAAINKPPGIVVHPSPGNYTGTIVHGLLHHFNELSEATGSDKTRPGIVHRLDKETSGILLIAKSDEAHNRITALFKERKMKKTYQAILHGRIRAKEGVVNEPIGRSNSDRKKMGIRHDDKARDAKTRYKILEECENFLLAEFYPETGRTHQIRVHAQFLKVPVVGDKLYGLKKFPFQNIVHRHLLHARNLCFTHPFTGKEMQLEAPHFEDFSLFLSKVFELPKS